MKLVHINVVHQTFFRHEDRLLCRTSNADAQHARRTPSRAHRRHGFEDPVHHRVTWVEHDHFAFILRAAALGGHGDFNGVAWNNLRKDDGWRIVFGVFSQKFGVCDNAGTQRVVRMVVSLANAFVNGVIETAREAFPTDVHAHLEKDIDDAGVLANGAVSGGAHFAVRQNLGNRVFGRRALLAFVSAG